MGVEFFTTFFFSLMVLIIDGVKYACGVCVRGHRASSCSHNDRQLFEIRKKGRPPLRCKLCRDLKRKKLPDNSVCQACVLTTELRKKVMPTASSFSNIVGMEEEEEYMLLSNNSNNNNNNKTNNIYEKGKSKNIYSNVGSSHTTEEKRERVDGDDGQLMLSEGESGREMKNPAKNSALTSLASPTSPLRVESNPSQNWPPPLFNGPFGRMCYPLIPMINNSTQYLPPPPLPPHHHHHHFYQPPPHPHPPYYYQPVALHSSFAAPFSYPYFPVPPSSLAPPPPGLVDPGPFGYYKQKMDDNSSF